MKKAGVFLLLNLILPILVIGQNQPVNLKTLIENSLQNNIQIKDSRLQTNIAKSKVDEAFSSALPQINAFGQFDDNLKLPTVFLPGELMQMPGMDIPVQFGKQYNAKGAIEFSQIIYNHQLLKSIQLTKENVKFYQLGESKSEEDVIYKVSSAYYSFLTATKQLDLIDANIKRLEELLVITNSLVDADLGLQTDSDRIQVNIQNLKSQKVILLNNIDFLKDYLFYLSGIDENENTKAISIIEFNDALNIEFLKNFETEKQRTEIQLLDQQKSILELQKQSINAGYLPYLVAFGQFGIQGQSNEFDYFSGNLEWKDYSIIGLKLNIPIFDGLNKKSKSKQISTQIQQVDYKLEDTKRILSIEKESALKKFNTSYKSLNIYKENIKLAIDIYNQSNVKFQEGIAPLTDLLMAETSLRESENNYYQAFLNYKIAELDILKSTNNLKSLIQ